MRSVFFCLLFVPFPLLRGNVLSQGRDYSLECLNDYVFTITCELNASSDLLAQGATSWLEFCDDRGPFQCVLKAQAHLWVCEVLIEDTFIDADVFQISLNSSYHGNSSSAVLEERYEPVKHIRPVPPSNLSLLWETDRVVFYWLSGYQEDTLLTQNLQYQLSIHGDKVEDVHPKDTYVAVETSSFAPQTNYTARVRSIPNQLHYKGVWSHWGPTVHWTTKAREISDSSYSSIWFALFCLLLVLSLLLSYIPYYRWKKCVWTPSPTPFIRDFKSHAMLPGIVTELLQGEESLKIDSMIEESDSASSPSPARYEKMRNLDHSERTFITSSSLAASPSMLLSPARVELSPSSWLTDFTATERGSVTCSEDYCTLSHARMEHATN